jgi:hypothetical protein
MNAKVYFQLLLKGSVEVMLEQRAPSSLDLG